MANNANKNHTELVWSGKFTEELKLPSRRTVNTISLPFQTIEVINEPREGNYSGLLFGGQRKEGWRNKLIWGDNKLIIASLLKDFAGKITLIYIDPPFDVGADFSVKVKVGNKEVTKEPSILEEKAYRDTWGKGTDSYLEMIYERLLLLRDLLSNDGSIYIHCDYRVNAYMRLILDEIFGKDNFRNEIIWGYRTGGISKDFFARKHDTIFYYTKSFAETKFNTQYYKSYQQKKYNFKGVEDLWDEEKKSWYHNSVCRDVWEDIYPIGTENSERLEYPTQKPEALMERIINASSNEGDIIADFFCGSGTTGAVAERLGRRWIMSDLGRFAIHTARKRLMEVQRKLKDDRKEYYSFEILNLGKYERQHWQTTLTNGSKNKATDYIKFIIQLYKAEALSGFVTLHGKKDNRAVHVGAVDAPVTISEVMETLQECQDNKLNKLDILGWEWEMSVNEEAVKIAKSQGVELRLLQIPKEVMERQAVEQGDVKFFELDHMAVEVERQGNKAKVKLAGFAIPSEDLIPDDLREKITNWADYVDYWSVDWDYESLQGNDDNSVFENNWQSFRSRGQPKLELETPWHEYKRSGTYSICVKAIDIFGNDTSKVIEVKIK